MKQKVFITGGGGMLASVIEKFYSEKNAKIIAPSHEELDVLDCVRLNQAISNFKPDLVFHTAALHVNDCEENPELAFKLNAWATMNLARICQKFKTRFVYISSCGYFGDEIKYYSEYDPVILMTIYARSKYQGEVLAIKECENTFAIRPGWLFGGSINHNKNFVYQRYKEAKKSPTLKSANDKYGCPTFVEDLVIKIDEILNTQIPGIYHVTNSGGCTRFEYIKKIIESCGLKTEVIAVDSSNFTRKANVPNCELLYNWNLKYLGLSPMPSWEDAIERYVKQIFEEI